MEAKTGDLELEFGVFELPGEPAVVINGVPKVNPDCNAIVPSEVEMGGGESQKDKGCGEWLEGREVQKLFGDRYYRGSVVQFDKETGWYRVEYEDGDSEDLDWLELEEVLVPVDITVPLKALAMKMFKKNQNAAIQKHGKSVSTASAVQMDKHMEKKPENGEEARQCP